MAEGDRHPRLIRSTPRLTREEIVSQSFPQSFRGLSEASVRAFLRRVADEYDALRTRQDELFAELEALEAHLSAQPEPTVPHEDDLLTAVGEETARVLRSAKDSAEQIRRNAEEKATELLREAHEEARALRGEAEEAAASRTREMEEAAAEMLREAERLARDLQEGAEARVAEFEARAEADAKSEVESARRRSREMVAEAEVARDRTLGELARRREALDAQIDMLRAGRDRLIEAYRVVKVTLDQATESLRMVDARPAPEASRPRVASAALPPRHAEPVAAEPEPEREPEPEVPDEPAPPEREPELAEPAEPAEPPRVGSLTLGELDTPRPAPPIEKYKVDQPSGVRLLGTEREPVAAEPEPEPEPEPVAPDHARHEDVEELFARLRAEREQPPEEPPEPPEESPAEPPEEPAEEVLAPEAVLARRRDDVLEPLVDELVRAVKRVVRDEQNVVLQAVREHRGTPTADDVLPALDEQDAVFADATTDVLNEACAAGEALARELGVVGGINGDGARRRARAGELAAALARELMDPLRGKLGAALREGATSGEPGQVGERVRGRYREWKGRRVDAACRNALAGAYARGLFDAVPDGVPLRWVTTDANPCPDCADNTLEQAPRGQRFPTGHATPPAHPGCHCLVLPAEVPAEVEVG